MHSPDAKRHYNIMRSYAKALATHSVVSEVVGAELMLALCTEQYSMFSLADLRMCVEEYLTPLVLIEPMKVETTIGWNDMVAKHNITLQKILEETITFPY
jgi:uncharacterized membrane protein (DUF373 family)